MKEDIKEKLLSELRRKFEIVDFSDEYGYDNIIIYNSAYSIDDIIEIKSIFDKYQIKIANSTICDCHAKTICDITIE